MINNITIDGVSCSILVSSIAISILNNNGTIFISNITLRNNNLKFSNLFVLSDLYNTLILQNIYLENNSCFQYCIKIVKI